MSLPEIVDADRFEQAHAALIADEKRATRERDALAARRRRQPMTEITGDFAFDGPDGRVGLVDLFQGRRQLLLYHFWFPQGGSACGGCTMFTDQIAPLDHLNARDASFALVSPATQEEIRPYRERMGWTVPWYTTVGDGFQTLRGTTEYFKLDVYLRDEDDRVFLTYWTESRGVEALGSVWSFLDLLPFGRQEEWEDTPDGRVEQTPAYRWWRKRGDY